MGGVAHEWKTRLDADVVPGSPYTLELVMTKHMPPDVRIGYQVIFR